MLLREGRVASAEVLDFKTESFDAKDEAALEARALAQCRAFVARLKAAHPDLELVEEQVVTTGDRIQDLSLIHI